MKRKHSHNQKKNRYSFFFPILTIIIIIIGFIIIISTNYDRRWSYNWSGIRKEIKDSIEIAELHGITSGIGGNGVSTKSEVDRRTWIMKTATKSELFKLTKYPNGTVKAIAYEGLLRNKEFNEKVELIFRAIEDTTYRLSYQSGCIGWYRGIGEYLIEDILMFDNQVPILTSESQTEFGFTQIDKEKIISKYRKYQKRSQKDYFN